MVTAGLCILYAIIVYINFSLLLSNKITKQKKCMNRGLYEEVNNNDKKTSFLREFIYFDVDTSRKGFNYFFLSRHFTDHKTVKYFQEDNSLTCSAAEKKHISNDLKPYHFSMNINSTTVAIKNIFK